MAVENGYLDDETEGFTRSGVFIFVVTSILTLAVLYNVMWREHPPVKSLAGPAAVIEIDAGKKTAIRNPPSTQARVEVEGSSLPEPPAPKADPLIAAIERELIAAGLLNPPARGLPDQRVRDAIAAWQASKGLPVTGAAHQDLLERLIYERQIREAMNFAPDPQEAAAPSAEIPAGPVASDATGDARIRMVQQGLAALGYRPGPITGEMTPETQAAIRQFEKDRALAPTGKLSKRLLSEMREFAPAQ